MEQDLETKNLTMICVAGPTTSVGPAASQSSL